MKIALSASYFNIPAVAAELKTCDVVFTTNASQVDNIRKIVGDKLRVVEGPFEAIEALRANYPGAEFVGFPAYRRIIKAQLLNGDQETAKLLTGYCGWTSEPKQLYDEEGIDGYNWFRRDGTGESFETVDDDVPAGVIREMAKGFC